MPMLVVGVSHHTAPLDLREALSLEGRLEGAYGSLAEAAEELVLVSTCNRVEAYAEAADPRAAEARLRGFFEGLAPDMAPRIRKALKVLHGDEALWHLLRVAASLDSMVLGETQILGQMKAAYEGAVGAGRVGARFHGVFQRAFAAAKRVRNSTEIGRHPASVPSVAAQVAERLLGELKGRAVAVLGGGDMAELTAEHLVSSGADRLAFCNRYVAKARELARRFKGKAAGLDDLEGVLAEADVLVCSTGAPRALVGPDLAAAAQARRHRRPQLFIDISVPRNIDPAVGALENVYLYNLDDLDTLASEHRGRREQAAREAEELLREALDGLHGWAESSRLGPALGRLSAHFESVRAAEVARASGRLSHLRPEDREKVEALTRAITHRLLHGPLVRIKAQALKGGGSLLKGAEELFGLEPGDES